MMCIKLTPGMQLPINLNATTAKVAFGIQNLCLAFKLTVLKTAAVTKC